MKLKLIFIAFMLFAQAALADCPQFYPLGRAVAVADSIELCNSFYVVEFDAQHHAPIISAERFRLGNHPERTNDFHPDDRLQNEDHATHSDYAKTGYDQGHLTPAADATDADEMHDTFLMSNMTPQEPTLNRESWRMLEIHVRQLEPDYVLTGAVYPVIPSTIGSHHVPVPSGYYKIIWKGGVISAWHADNAPKAQVSGISIESIESMSGLKFPRY